MWNNTKDYCSDKQYKKIQDSWVLNYQKELNFDYYWGPYTVRKVKENEVQKYYWEGRLLKRLELMDYQQFKRRVSESGYFYGSKKWKRERIRNHYKYNRNGKRNPTNYSEKKVLSEKEQAKRQWRKFKKDRRTQKFHKNYRGVKQRFKHDCARFHRNFERHCLANGNYDQLHDRTWKQVINWWSYD